MYVYVSLVLVLHTGLMCCLGVILYLRLLCVCRQGKDWSALRRPISKYMLTPAVVKSFSPDFNDISRDLVDYVRRHKDKETGEIVLKDSARSFFKLTHECELISFDLLTMKDCVYLYTLRIHCSVCCM